MTSNDELSHLEEVARRLKEAEAKLTELRDDPLRGPKEYARLDAKIVGVIMARGYVIEQIEIAQKEQSDGE